MVPQKWRFRLISWVSDFYFDDFVLIQIFIIADWEIAFSKEPNFNHLSGLYPNRHSSTVCVSFDWSFRMFSTHASFNFEINEEKVIWDTQNAYHVKVMTGQRLIIRLMKTHKLWAKDNRFINSWMYVIMRKWWNTRIHWIVLNFLLLTDSKASGSNLVLPSIHI